jgi:hypothetical protein
MPALGVAILQPALEAAFKTTVDSDGVPVFVKRNLDGSVVQPLELADGTKKLIEAITNGVVTAWATWQSTQVVSPAGVPPMSNGGGPVVGFGSLP